MAWYESFEIACVMKMDLIVRFLVGRAAHPDMPQQKLAGIVSCVLLKLWRLADTISALAARIRTLSYQR